LSWQLPRNDALLPVTDTVTGTDMATDTGTDTVTDTDTDTDTGTVIARCADPPPSRIQRELRKWLYQVLDL